jgi:hypothetical protein
LPARQASGHQIIAGHLGFLGEVWNGRLRPAVAWRWGSDPNIAKWNRSANGKTPQARLSWAKGATTASMIDKSD